jgi:hypothetical protein
MERSGTDEQIVVRLQRGDLVESICNELGCGHMRVKRLAALHGIERRRGVMPIDLKGERTLKTTPKRHRSTPCVTVPVWKSWGWVKVRYDKGAVIITKGAKP